MSLQSKAKAELKRKRLKQQQELEFLKLEKNAKRLQTLVGGFSFNAYRPRSSKLEKPKPQYRNYQGTLPAKPDPVYVPKEKIVYAPDMQARENKAQQAIKEKEALVMPVYNKGGYQLPTESNLKDFKQGLLRRRS